MMERAIEPIGTYKKEQIEGDKKTLAGLVSEEKEEYQTIQGGTDKPVIVRKSEKQGMNTLPERSADPLRGELAKMIETHSVYRLRSRELIKERTELQQSSDTLKQKYEDILGKYKHLDIFQECLQMQLAAVKKREIVYGGLLIGGAFIYAVSIPLMCYYFTN
ncbi:hypothetical protein HZA99_03140 [Candidatus Woesearchaeota archaeon]|nr:hypothetical protein [Candidatus Woesearchaeota archaeon]